MTCKHNWTFIDGLTKRIRCIKCAALQFVNPKDEYVVEGLKLHDPRPNSIIFYNGGNPSEENEVMRLSAEGVKVNPKFTVDEATGYVIKALDSYLKAMGQKEYERGCLEAQAKIREGYERRIGELKHYEDLWNNARYFIGTDIVDGKRCVVVLRENEDDTSTMVAHEVLEETK